MARVLVWVPDLLFGSQVVAAVRAAGHDPDLVAALPEAPVAELAVVDLTAEAPDRIAQARLLGKAGIPVLAFYSHVESEIRAQALEAGLTQVVPRSRMAREGAALVAGLLAS